MNEKHFVCLNCDCEFYDDADTILHSCPRCKSNDVDELEEV